MKNKLKEIIEYGVKQGFSLSSLGRSVGDELIKWRPFPNRGIISLMFHHEVFPDFDADIDYEVKVNIVELLYLKAFAKAVFGEEDYPCYYGDDDKISVDKDYPHDDRFWWTIKSWQYHLQQMVLEEEPLKYLEEFL